MQRTWIPFLGQEDPLEKEMATHSTILAWEIPWTEEHDGLQSLELQRVKHDLATKHTQIVKTESFNITLKLKDFFKPPTNSNNLPTTLRFWSLKNELILSEPLTSEMSFFIYF